MRTLICVIFIALAGVLKAEDNTRACLEYIDQYKYIAVSEMSRGGIPASVKLAQALLETNAGNGKLAINALNHFGIKCGDWGGATYHTEDDDYVKGKLVKSCFRKYEFVSDSYIDHTDFLMTKSRYSVLFTYDKYDYTSWCRGLKACGYATLRTYDEALLKMIERYELWQYDYMDIKSGEMIVMADKFSEMRGTNLNLPSISTANTSMASNTEEYYFTHEQMMGVVRTSIYKYSHNESVFQHHGLDVVVVGKGETPNSLAKRYGVKLNKLRKINEVPKDGHFVAGTYCYLEEKHSKPITEKRFYIVREGETIWDIAQNLGVKSDFLKGCNNLFDHEEVKAGEKIYLYKVDEIRRPKVCSSTEKLKEARAVATRVLSTQLQYQGQAPLSRNEKLRQGTD